MQLISLKGTQIELTDAIKDYVDVRLKAIEKFTTDFGMAEISVECGRTSGHHNKGNVYRCEMTLQVPGKVLRAQREAEDLYEAIDLVKDELVRQVKDYKGILSDSHRGARPDKV
ncbi:ribosomal subunit interface protein [Candidatus Uhrbacteria bacterium RIFCSPHIGHO2_01_FULL_63_20]|uniref:Ribosomal subunit interface protein n=1 Tax=Candidatus Uhrbacteria bacterium RIFCSPHIGHO2_01_FULL_63_20 TaxID=1802385 RepID=A0A1F7TKB0_9BACT|nr:MAG: ribosomal subunit interface protein [Candidatus Uhrbacteria bacterium RIFCSPHIGHO2_01_FULL_63_20]